LVKKKEIKLEGERDGEGNKRSENRGNRGMGKARKKMKGLKETSSK